jgi:hypothetical protein
MMGLLKSEMSASTKNRTAWNEKISFVGSQNMEQYLPNVVFDISFRLREYVNIEIAVMKAIERTPMTRMTRKEK